jgi:hypothetical protein
MFSHGVNNSGTTVAFHTVMDQRNPGPGSGGPDYLSVVIEWEPDPVEHADDPPTSPTDAWDAIDEASDESFPASDPPARGSPRAAPSESTALEVTPRYEAPRRAARWLGTVVVAVVLGGLLAWLRHRHAHAA